MHILPDRTDTAYANMATDLMLLEADSGSNVPCLRHYGWANPAWSFGLSQKWTAQGAPRMAKGVEIVRRPTGGGLVDHAEDWTFSLIVPASSPGYRDDPTIIYRIVHEKLAAALNAQGIPAELYQKNPTGGVNAVCFNQPENFDVVLPGGGGKIAGAAQKRNRHGLLMQGSLVRDLPGAVDWYSFKMDFAQGLAEHFGGSLDATDFPSLDEGRLAYEAAKFASSEWNQRR